VVYIGPPGPGHKIKLLNQMMFGAINAMTAEMMAIAEKVGIAPALLYDTITASQAGTVSNLFKELGQRISEGRYDEPTFSVDLLSKDVRLGLEMGTEAGAAPILGAVVDFLNKSARAKGLGAQDSSVMWQAVREFWEQ
jgi:3-hydroxyisobutyrate dehydrogenase-like beta-hydroxyacid dehydrogenase